MSITPTKSASGEIAPKGNHLARLYRIIHIGTLDGEYLGEPKQTNTVRLSFELPLETTVFKEGDEPKPYVISQEYTLSLGEKANLGKTVRGMKGEAWGPNFDEGQDISLLVGTPCMLNIIHKTSQAGNVYAKIESAAPLPKGIEAPAAVNPPFILDFQENWTDAKFASLPDFLKEKIQGSPEYRFMKDGPNEFDKTPDPEKTYASSLSTVKYPEAPEIDPATVPF